MRPWRVLAALALVAGLGLWSLAAGLAGLAAWRAEVIALDNTPAPMTEGGEAEREIRRSLGLAAGLDPGPARAEAMAAHLETLALAEPPRSPAERALLIRSESLYREAALARPTWPMALAAILRIRLKLGHLDGDFGALYRRAAALGRLEPKAQSALVDLALVAWPLLDADTRRLALDHLRLRLAEDPKPVLLRAAGLPGRVAVERLAESDPRLRALWEGLSRRPTGTAP